MAAAAGITLLVWATSAWMGARTANDRFVVIRLDSGPVGGDLVEATFRLWMESVEPLPESPALETDFPGNAYIEGEEQVPLPLWSLIRKGGLVALVDQSRR